MNIVHNPVHQDRTKHIKRHFIKDNLDRNLTVTTHVSIGI